VLLVLRTYNINPFFTTNRFTIINTTHQLNNYYMYTNYLQIWIIVKIILNNRYILLSKSLKHLKQCYYWYFIIIYYNCHVTKKTIQLLLGLCYVKKKKKKAVKFKSQTVTRVVITNP